MPDTQPPPHSDAPPSQHGRVLVVDDEHEHAATLVRLLKREGLHAVAVHSVNEAMDAVRSEPWDIVLTDLVMPGKSGTDLLRAMQTLGDDTDVILMTAFGTVERAVEAMHAGAADFIAKPIRRAALMKSVRRSLERSRLVRENASLRAELERLRGNAQVVGQAPSFRRALRLARQAAASDATVLLLGESGAGKEVFAREVHRASRRADGPFVPVHCAAMPVSIIESELFGHEAGAFTGARQRAVGRFEAADGGTLFLDEVGEIPPSVQVKLLRVLQEGELQRVGGNDPVRIDVRIVAATHRDLAAMVEDGRFREDLYYRLAVIPVDVPSLRDRVDDIALLSTHFVADIARRNDRTPPALTAPVIRALERWPWPGNVRELQNTLERAVVLDNDGIIDLDDLPDDIAGGADSDTPEVIALPVGTSLAEAERRMILATLRHAGGDKALAASILGVGRRTVYRKLDEYGDDEG